jgi:hypothetical protein
LADGLRPGAGRDHRLAGRAHRLSLATPASSRDQLGDGEIRAFKRFLVWVGLDTCRMVEVGPGRFEAIVSEALDGLPDELGELMSNVAVTVQHDVGPAGLLGSIGVFR